MQKVDIRPLKQEMRNRIKQWRRSMPQEQKIRADAQILERILKLREYGSAGQLLTYLSLPMEVDTRALVEQAWADGKQVAAPRCVPGSREMEFFYIRSMEDLAPQSFGVLEPVPERCVLVRQFDPGGLCIVPALACDQHGFRLGYGAGYYDRFLSRYPGSRVGIVYDQNLVRRLWNGRYDVPLHLIVTEKRLWVCGTGLRQTRPMGRKK